MTRSSSPGPGARGLRLAPLAALALAAAACGPDGGIVLEIRRAPGADSEISRLEVRVGVGHDDTGSRAIDPDWWLAAPVADGRGVVALPGGLGTTTFRYKLEASDSLPTDQPLVVAVIGYGPDPASPPILFGHTSGEGVRFADGQVRVIDLPLATFSSTRHGVGRAGCVWWLEDAALAEDPSPLKHAIVPGTDSDCDGFAEGNDENGACQLDCNDLDPDISPAAREVCMDGIDQNCCAFDRDGTADPDGDGVNGCSQTPDCVDMPRGTVVAVDVFGEPVTSEQIHPGALEVCDGVDNDCKGGCDDDPGLDGDGDGWLNCKNEEGELEGVHRKDDGRCVAAALDCADELPVRNVPAEQINPGATDDDCDQVDNDCSGECDETQLDLGDQDTDGFPACGTVREPDGELPVCRVARVSDCDDEDPFGRPGIFERCDGLDFACDGSVITEPLPCLYTDAGDRCLLGQRACHDGTGDPMPVGDCMPDPSFVGPALPPAFCEASCPADDISDCIRGGDDRECQLPFPMVPGSPSLMPCLPADVPLTSDPPPTCRWTLAGGEHQGDWKVTLQRGAMSGPSFDGCGLPAVSLRVVAAAPGAADVSVLIVNATGVQVVSLRRREVAVCEGGIVCQ